MLIRNSTYGGNILGREFGGQTDPFKYFKPATMRGWYCQQNTDNTTLLKFDSFPTGTNHPYSLMMGDRGALLSSTTTINGTGTNTFSMAMGLAAESDLLGNGDLLSNLSLVIQLACDILGSSIISASLVGKLEMTSDLAASGDLTSALSLFAFVISDIIGSGTIAGTVYGTASLEANISSSSTLSPENLAAAVWNSLAASFNNAGTMGEILNNVGAGADPWGTVLPGTYNAGEAGNILGNLLASIPQSVWDELKASHTTPNSYGKIVQDIETDLITINDGVKKASILVPHTTNL